MFSIDANSIDKSLPVPVGTQLYGLLSYALSFGGIAHGTRLQSVRQLAAELGIAPMTVAQVYQRLRDAGLVEMKHGLGAFAVSDVKKRGPDTLPVSSLRADIEVLIGKAEKLGISTLTLNSMINAQSLLRRPKAGLKIVFVAIFEGPGRDYVAQLKPVLATNDTIQLITLDSLRVTEELRRMSTEADIVLTFLHREAEVQALIPEARVLGLRFIPSMRTRQALAGLDPRTRIAAVTYFEEYIAIMRPSVREFAPHVSDIRVTWLSSPDLGDVIAQCDAVIFASGADHVADLVQPGVPCFEYRHAPDPGALEGVLVPHLADLRRGKIAVNETAPEGGGAEIDATERDAANG
jgi:DNA-binding transcriptional regulator YhcF (GntR family)